MWWTQWLMPKAVSRAQSQLVPHDMVMTSEVMRVTHCREWGWQRMPEDEKACYGRRDGAVLTRSQAPLLGQSGQRNTSVWLLKYLLEWSELHSLSHSMFLHLAYSTLYKQAASPIHYEGILYSPTPTNTYLTQRNHAQHGHSQKKNKTFPPFHPPPPSNSHCCRLPLPLLPPLSLTITPHFGSKAKVPQVRR